MVYDTESVVFLHEEIARLFVDSTQRDQPIDDWPDFDQFINDWRTDDHPLVAFIEIEETVHTFALLSETEGNKYLIKALYSYPEARGRGAATCILKRLLQEPCSLFAFVSRSTKLLWEKAGFHDCGNRASELIEVRSTRTAVE